VEAAGAADMAGAVDAEAAVEGEEEAAVVMAAIDNS
jgi:hypothetical protein